MTKMDSALDALVQPTVVPEYIFSMYQADQD